MTPLGRKVASEWLRARARALWDAASRADKAYTKGGYHEASLRARIEEQYEVSPW